MTYVSICSTTHKKKSEFEEVSVIFNFSIQISLFCFLIFVNLNTVCNQSSIAKLPIVYNCFTRKINLNKLSN